jgi:hypothetical protein
MNSVEKGKGPDLPLSPTPPSSTGGESTSSGNNSQAGDYNKHPYLPIRGLLAEGYSMALQAETVKSKLGCLAKLKVTANYLSQVETLLGYYQLQGKSSMETVTKAIQKAITLAEDTEDVESREHGRYIARDVQVAIDRAIDSLYAIMATEGGVQG